VLSLLDTGDQAGVAEKDPELDKPQGLARRAVALRVQGALRAEIHHLRPTGVQVAVVAERIGVRKVAPHHVGQRLDVAVWMHGPRRAPDDPVIVEDAQRATPSQLGSWYSSKEKCQRAWNQPPSCS